MGARKFQRKTAQARKISHKTIALGVEIIATTEGNWTLLKEKGGDNIRLPQSEGRTWFGGYLQISSPPSRGQPHRNRGTQDLQYPSLLLGKRRKGLLSPSLPGLFLALVCCFRFNVFFLQNKTEPYFVVFVNFCNFSDYSWLQAIIWSHWNGNLGRNTVKSLEVAPAHSSKHTTTAF